jgi:YD repeat-containing protein
MDGFSEVRGRANVARGLPTLCRRIFFLLVACFLTPAWADIQYVYDEVGRLVQVTDPVGASAQYTYDAAGNITGISQLSASTLSIVEFTPSAPVGATVTVYGTGFSTTPSQNTVRFNGTTATVSLSTPTQLTATVPSGATTGPVSVQVGGTTTTSTTNFTVLSGSLLPTIASFTPSLATVGTTVTVSGTNFDIKPANDRLSFNGTLASTTTATTAQLDSKVPVHATSGKLTVLTPNGSAVSANDFFVPPPGYLAADVGFTGRTTVNGTLTVNTASAGKIGIIVFEGVKGQQLGMGATNVAFNQGWVSVPIYVKLPNGDNLASISVGPGDAAGSLPVLPATGTYTILVVPPAGYSVSMILSLSQDVASSMVAGGSPLTVGTTFPGQRVNVAFNGTAGQRVSLKMSGITITGDISLSLSILKPDGSALAGLSFVTSGGGFIDVQTLPVSGTYRIIIDPAGVAVASGTLTLYDVPSDTTTGITAGGAAVVVTTTVPGQSAKMTFAGTSGQRVGAAITDATLTGSISNNWADVALIKPDGTTLTTLSNVGASGFMGPSSLPTSGTYTLSYHPTNGAAGSATFTLYDVPPDTTAAITAGGSPVTVNTAVGQQANLTFSGTSAQRISLGISAVSLTGQTPSYLNSALVTISKPDGGSLVSTSIGGSSFIDSQTLPTTGTYTVSFDPSNQSVGTATFTLYDVPANASSSVAIGGTSTTVTITVPGQNAEVTFSGAANQQVTAHIAGTSGLVYVYVLKPDGSTLNWTQTYASSFSLGPQTLPTSGTYKVSIDPGSDFTGTITVSVTSP